MRAPRSNLRRALKLFNLSRHVHIIGAFYLERDVNNGRSLGQFNFMIFMRTHLSSVCESFFYFSFLLLPPSSPLFGAFFLPDMEQVEFILWQRQRSCFFDNNELKARLLRFFCGVQCQLVLVFCWTSFTFMIVKLLHIPWESALFLWHENSCQSDGKCVSIE